MKKLDLNICIFLSMFMILFIIPNAAQSQDVQKIAQSRGVSTHFLLTRIIGCKLPSPAIISNLTAYQAALVLSEYVYRLNHRDPAGCFSSLYEAKQEYYKRKRLNNSISSQEKDLPETLAEGFNRDRKTSMHAEDKRLIKNLGQVIRLKNNDRNKEEGITVAPLARGIDLRARLNRMTRNNNRRNNSVLGRAYRDWPGLKRYVERNGIDNIRGIDRRRNTRSNFNWEKATIEIAIPNRQFRSSNLKRTITDRLGVDLPEYDYEPIRRTRSVDSRDYVRTNRVRSQPTVGTRTNASTSSRSRAGGNRTRNRSRDGGN